MTQISTLLIGDEALTCQCGQMLLDRGHTIAAVITRNPEVREWAVARGLRAENLDADLAMRLVGAQVDWLLSIANLQIIPAPVLALARKGGVNFHDGPLPGFAGLNAPVWSILNGEVRHAISWHLMADGVDEGDVLESAAFDVSLEDTALTLNTRCFEAAVNSFVPLLQQLETGALQRQPQDLSLRHLYLRSDRPAAMGRIDFAKTAEDIVRLVRGLDHGRYWNPLTTAKLTTATMVLAVQTAGRAPGSGAPGQVLSATAEGLVVACADGAVHLSGLTCLAKGEAISAAAIADIMLPQLSKAEADHLTSALKAVAPGEPHLRARLADLLPAEVPMANTARAAADWQSLPLDLAAVPEGRRHGILAMAATRATGQAISDFAYSAMPSTAPGYLSDWVPLRVDSQVNVGLVQKTLSTAMGLASITPGFPLDLMVRDARLTALPCPQLGLSLWGPIAGTVATLTAMAVHFDASRLTEQHAQALAARITAIAVKIAALPETVPLKDVDALTEVERAQVLYGWNQTQTPYDAICMHQAFEAQVIKTPDATALVCDGDALGYAALNARANKAAHVLIGLGVRPGMLVGLCLHRSLDLVVAALAILKAGGAYVPMDPAYPADRTALFIEDSAVSVIVTQSALRAGLPATDIQLLCLDTDTRLEFAPTTNPQTAVTAADLAYVIYTSGSTGRPKGVMVEHRNVANFFAGMDERIAEKSGVWLAVTSLSFDISVLEVFWTLARGFKVVLTSDDNRALVSAGTIISAQKMDFSLYYWGNDDGVGPKKYELLLEGAKFADKNGFCAVWTPERHFHAFGGPYPNPSVTGAAVAAVTKNIGVRAGSCVVPLHHPARIAEDWAVIDNLTNGRAGIAVASGWHPDDFVLRPENTPPHNKKAMFEAADQVRRLWRGEKVDFPTADGGSFGVITQPRPVSKELPIWVTTAGNPETWKEAGQLGANVLTHLLGQTVDEVEAKIKLYHSALREAGFDPASRVVTMMLHSYVATDRETARAVARAPMKDYLRSAAALIKQYAWAFPAFKRPQGVAKPMDIDIQSLAADEMDAILDFAFQRYFDESGLFGTVDDALARVEQLKRIGVGEVACLIDYGIAPDVVLAGLVPLAQVVARANLGAGIASDDFSIAAQIVRHKVTHLQCTPSMARMIALNEGSRQAMAGVTTLMLGGEALPSALVADLRGVTQARIMNMYGPTETTIWSSTETVGDIDGVANIGTPLANQQMYVLDSALIPVAPGIAGDLWIGGHGVTRGYWQRPDLTEQRFLPDPFVRADQAAPWGARMYQTGDVVRWRSDGKIDFIGRADGQVKMRGYRIELGEIEQVLDQQPGVTQAVVLMREDTPGDVRLVAYYTGAATPLDLRTALAARLPDHMVPAHFVQQSTFALTPNRKVDRKALPAPVAATANFTAPATDVEGQLAAIWKRVLGVDRVGAKDNFFALGGHSLLAVQLHREIREILGTVKLSITDIFRFPTLQAMAAHIDGAAPRLATGIPPQKAGLADRADARADAMERRRAMRQARL